MIIEGRDGFKKPSWRVHLNKFRITENLKLTTSDEMSLNFTGPIAWSGTNRFAREVQEAPGDKKKLWEKIIALAPDETGPLRVNETCFKEGEQITVAGVLHPVDQKNAIVSGTDSAPILFSQMPPQVLQAYLISDAAESRTDLWIWLLFTVLLTGLICWGIKGIFFHQNSILGRMLFKKLY